MATVDIIKISDGTTDIGLILEDDGFQMLASGNDFGVPEHDNVYHESSYSNGAALVRERKKNRVWPMKLSVRGSTPDIVINNLITLAKHARQSARQQMLSDIDKVYLSIKIYGSTNTTYYDVVDIEVNGIDILSYINRNLQEIIFGNGLSISVTTKPLGYGDKEILCNILTYPDFHVDTNYHIDNTPHVGIPDKIKIP